MCPISAHLRYERPNKSEKEMCIYTAQKLKKKTSIVPNRIAMIEHSLAAPLRSYPISSISYGIICLDLIACTPPPQPHCSFFSSASYCLFSSSPSSSSSYSSMCLSSSSSSSSICGLPAALLGAPPAVPHSRSFSHHRTLVFQLLGLYFFISLNFIFVFIFFLYFTSISVAQQVIQSSYHQRPPSRLF